MHAIMIIHSLLSSCLIRKALIVAKLSWNIYFAISDKVTFEELSDLLSEKLDKRNGIKEMHAAFELFDSDSKGYITVDDLRKVAKELGETIAEDQLEVGLTNSVIKRSPILPTS